MNQIIELKQQILRTKKQIDQLLIYQTKQKENATKTTK